MLDQSLLDFFFLKIICVVVPRCCIMYLWFYEEGWLGK